MTEIEQLLDLQRQIARCQAHLSELTAQAEAIGFIIHCACYEENCQEQALVRRGEQLPRGWLQKICHGSGDATHYCPEHWDNACLDDTDYWSSAGDAVRLPHRKDRRWDAERWRRIKKKYGAR